MEVRLWVNEKNGDKQRMSTGLVDKELEDL